MPAYDLETASATDHRFFDSVKEGILYQRDTEGKNTGVSSALKCKLQSVGSSEIAAVAASLGISPDDTLITAWLVDPNDAPPKAGWAIVIADVAWVIQRVFDFQTAQWQCVVASPGSRDVLGDF